MRRPLSKSQIVCISLLWLALCYLVLTKAERIDGMTVVMLVISAALKKDYECSKGIRRSEKKISQ